MTLAGFAVFEIEFLREPAILRWKLTGFWTVETAHRFAAALTLEMAKVRRSHSRFSSFSDTRGFPVQTAEVMKILTDLSRGPGNAGSRKLAILVSTALNSLQAEHTLASDRIHVFRDEGKAFAWLAQPTQRELGAPRVA
jgi:hypothetical protein